MARIPEAELERLKREISVERLAQARGIELQPHGANLIGLCPFHDDHAPSFVVTPSKNLWHCLGACQQGGSVIDFVMQAEGVSFRHAVELLRADLPLAAGSAPRRIVKDSTVTKLPPPVVPDAGDHEVARRGARSVITPIRSRWTSTLRAPRIAHAPFGRRQPNTRQTSRANSWRLRRRPPSTSP